MQRTPSQRAQSLAVLVPVFGLFLFLPPFITLFTGPARPFGIPLIVVYLFGVWAGLIVAAALLARRLQAHAGFVDSEQTAGDEPAAGPPPAA